METDFKGIEKRVFRILEDELRQSNISYDHADVRVYPVQSVGVQGDQRTYGHPAEITLMYRGEFVFCSEEFMRRLSSRITNEVKEINRVVYFLDGYRNKP